MNRVNENFLKLQNNYLFSTVAEKVEKYKQENPEKKVINLGVGDVTLPLPKAVVEAMKKACDEMQNKETFRGYGPELGYDFLKKKILEEDYLSKGIEFELDEIFISDGINSDIGNINDIFDVNNKVAIQDPVYPAYLDANVIAGRSGEFHITNYENIVYLVTNSTNNFVPEIPRTKVDLIYLCYPNNPTGMALTKEQLQEWVQYAKQNKSVILFDAAYEAFISDENIPHSIYEIEGAKSCAIEICSLSKTAGFTGVRCGYTIVPMELEVGGVALNKLWLRRQTTKFNGVPYIVQRGAAQVFSKEGRKATGEVIKYYKENAKIIGSALTEMGIEYVGGENSPYVWQKCPNGMKSWDFFDLLLKEANVVGTPGVGFGNNGEGYFRLTSFGDRENVIKAVERIKKLDCLK